jgi:SAM-dependent methyltransferase
VTSPSYAEQIAKEIANYRHVLNVDDLPAIYHHWSNRHLLPKLRSLGIQGIEPFFVAYAKRAAPEDGSPLTILSVGAGNCDVEVRIAGMLPAAGVPAFRFDCLDVNPHMLARGRETAGRAGLGESFRFIEADVNQWSIAERYHLIMANQSLHHFLELELLFSKIAASLREDGFFVTSDIVGRNGHMRWPEALDYVNRLWPLLEDRQRYNQQLRRLEAVYDNWDCSGSGFEGIRAQDILPLLIPRFHFDLFFSFANLIDVFIDRGFGHNFDAEDAKDKAFIDYVALLDDHLIEAGTIKPTHLMAAMTLSPRSTTRVYKHLTPQFCLRPPGEEASAKPPPPEAAPRQPAPAAEDGLRAALDVLRRTGALRFVPRPVKQQLKRLWKK